MPKGLTFTKDGSPVVWMYCLVCGRKKRTYPNRVRIGKSKYCSRACYDASGQQRRKNYTHLSLEELFWPKVQKGTTEDDCWGWVGNTSPRGYGLVAAKWIRAAAIRANRVSWMIHFGEIPDGLFVCHSCDNPPCTNPKHLFLGTAADNSADRLRKGRRGNMSHKLDPDYIPVIRRWLADGDAQRKVALCFGVTQATVRRVGNGQGWKHVA